MEAHNLIETTTTTAFHIISYFLCDCDDLDTMSTKREKKTIPEIKFLLDVEQMEHQTICDKYDLCAHDSTVGGALLELGFTAQQLSDNRAGRALVKMETTTASTPSGKRPSSILRNSNEKSSSTKKQKTVVQMADDIDDNGNLEPFPRLVKMADETWEIKINEDGKSKTVVKSDLEMNEAEQNVPVTVKSDGQGGRKYGFRDPYRPDDSDEHKNVILKGEALDVFLTWIASREEVTERSPFKNPIDIDSDEDDDDDDDDYSNPDNEDEDTKPAAAGRRRSNNDGPTTIYGRLPQDNTSVKKAVASMHQDWRAFLVKNKINASTCDMKATYKQWLPKYIGRIRTTRATAALHEFTYQLMTSKNPLTLSSHDVRAIRNSLSTKFTGKLKHALTPAGGWMVFDFDYETLVP